MVGSVREDVKWFSGFRDMAHTITQRPRLSVCLSVCLQASSVTTTRNLTKSDGNAMILQVKLDPCLIKYHNMKAIFTHGTRPKIDHVY